MALRTKKRTPASVGTAATKATIFVDSIDNQLKVKDEDGSVSRPGLSTSERTALVNLGSAKPFDETAIVTGSTRSHGLGSVIGKAAGAYFLKVEAFDSATGELVVGISGAKTTADQVTYSVSASVSPFTGTILLTAIPY